MSAKTERRVRASIPDELWVSGSARRLSGYDRRHFIDTLVDWGWFGKPGEEPGWYSGRVPRSG